MLKISTLDNEEGQAFKRERDIHIFNTNSRPTVNYELVPSHC